MIGKILGNYLPPFGYFHGKCVEVLGLKAPGNYSGQSGAEIGCRNRMQESGALFGKIGKASGADIGCRGANRYVDW